MATIGCSSSANATAVSYRQSIRSETDTIGQSLGTVAALFRAAHPDDPAWMQRVDSEIATWHNVRTQAEQLSPPSCLVPAQTRWVAALRILDAAGDVFRQGLATGDSAMVATAFDRVTQSSDQIATATKLVKSANC